MKDTDTLHVATYLTYLTYLILLATNLPYQFQLPPQKKIQTL